MTHRNLCPYTFCMVCSEIGPNITIAIYMGLERFIVGGGEVVFNYSIL